MSDFNFDKSSQLPLCGSFCVGKYIALVGDCPESAKSALSKRPEILKVYTLPPDPLIDSPIATHPDTILCIYKNNMYCHRKYAEDNGELLSEICEISGLEISPQDVERCGKYPYDIAFNAITFPEKDIVIGKKSRLCVPLKSSALNTNQGYAACCGLPVGDTLITADTSLIKSALMLGLEVYKVSGEDISLPGYEKGFIGGAAAYIDGTLYIFGDVQNSRTGTELAEFCRKTGIEMVSLCSGDVTDYGGIKFVPTKCKLPS